MSSQHTAPLAAFVLVTLMASGIAADALHDSTGGPIARDPGNPQVPLQVAPSPVGPDAAPTSDPSNARPGDGAVDPTGAPAPDRFPAAGPRPATSVGSAIPGYAALLRQLDQPAPAWTDEPDQPVDGPSAGAADQTPDPGGSPSPGQPSTQPTSQPSTSPTDPPTGPTPDPSSTPSTPPTESPSGSPSGSPTGSPTPSATGSPGTRPAPSASSSSGATTSPSSDPTTQAPTP